LTHARPLNESVSQAAIEVLSACSKSPFYKFHTHKCQLLDLCHVWTFGNRHTKKCMNDKFVAAALATLLSLLSNALRVSIADAMLF